MADEVDFSNQLSERERADQVQRIRDKNKMSRSLVPVGTCHYCDTEVNSNQLFCDHYCAEDYEKEVTSPRIRQHPFSQEC